MMRNLSRVTLLAATLMLAGGVVNVAGCASTKTQESTGQYIDDSAITAKVKAAILADDSLKSSEINVESFKGRVQLSGFVSSKADIDHAVTVAKGVKGVVAVENDMQLK